MRRKDSLALLLMLAAIAAIGAVVGSRVLEESWQRAARQQVVENLRKTERAMQVYSADNTEEYPTISRSATSPATQPAPER